MEPFLSTYGPAGPCLDDDEALEFLEGALTPAQAARVERHLADCQACRRLLVLAVEASRVAPERETAAVTANQETSATPETERSVLLARRAAEMNLAAGEDPMLGTRVGNFVIAARSHAAPRDPGLCSHGACSGMALPAADLRRASSCARARRGAP